jgi:hypothetical protein
MNIYYVYSYLRSRNSITGPIGTPYYIGKGSNGRAYTKHYKIPVPNDKSNIVLLETNLSENKAFEIEIFLINYYGRKDLGTGILYNRTNGGEGCSGMKHSDESKNKLSNANKGKILSYEHCQKLSNAKIGKSRLKFSIEHRLKISNANRNRSIVKCPHCGKIGKGGAMKQWHFNNCKNLVELDGLEPTTPCLQSRCSSN